MDEQKVIEHNQKAWDLNALQGIKWSIPVDDEKIKRARNGEFDLLLSPKTPIPSTWYGEIRNKKILGLAAGGGQQGPLLAAAGAQVTIVDLSREQLDRDKLVAEKHGLKIELIQSSADRLSMIEDHSQDLIINPVSNCFFPEIIPVWRECARVLRPGGVLLSAFNNPVVYCFDFEKANKGHFELKYSMPFSDVGSFTEEEKKKFLGAETPLEYGHSLTSQLGGLMAAGFVLEDLYEDYWDSEEPINGYLPQFINVKARKI